VWVEAGAGLVILVGVVTLRRVVSPRLAQLWWGPVALLGVGSVIGVGVGASQRLHDAAPVVAGLVGLLH
jgi:hypothetical protein